MKLIFKSLMLANYMASDFLSPIMDCPSSLTLANYLASDFHSSIMMDCPKPGWKKNVGVMLVIASLKNIFTSLIINSWIQNLTHKNRPYTLQAI